MKCGIVTNKMTIMLATVLLTLAMTTATGLASLINPAATYSYTASGDGLGEWWKYHLTITNTTTSDDGAYGDLYDFNFAIKDGASFSGGALPEGWDSAVWDGSIYQNGGYPMLSPSAWIFGTGIAPGESLSFDFGLSYRAPELTFTSTVWNPDGDPFVFDTVGLLNNETPTVPEPSTLLLVGAGLAGAMIWRRKLNAV